MEPVIRRTPRAMRPRTRTQSPTLATVCSGLDSCSDCYIEKSLCPMYLLIVILDYCATSPAPPTILNAPIPTPNQTVNSITYFTCNNGYQSNGGSSQPFFTCNPYTATAGSWSTGVTYSCDSLLAFISFFNLRGVATWEGIGHKSFLFGLESSRSK